MNYSFSDMNFITFICTLIFFSSALVNGQKTALDSANNIRIYRAVKEIAFRVFGRTGDDREYHREARHQKRVQRRIDSDVPFPCNVSAGRSKNVPESVHKLRPGDIDVIGAMGDSLTAGTGIFASSIFHLLIENRGVSALGGGQATWRDYRTIPNIIKAFNPDLIGYAPYDSLTHQEASGFNVAEIAAMSRDLPYMAENLVRRIQYHPDVDTKKSWKLIGILIGPNDFCSDMCWTTSGPWSILENHKNDLMETLRFLKDNLPRTLVSLIPPPNLIILAELREKSFQCKITTDFECSCLLGLHWRSQRKEFSEIMEAWQRIDEEVANYPEFQTEEFAVVAQPFATNLTFPKKPDGSADWRYLSSDCFHLSQIANARASTAIWKNMLEPVGRKTRDWSDDDTLACPTKSQPYITTLINSQENSNL